MNDTEDYYIQFQSFSDAIRDIQSNSGIKIVNNQRLTDVQNVYDTIKSISLSEGNRIDIQCYPHAFCDSMAVSIETARVDVTKDNICVFLRHMKYVNSFQIFPVLNGRIRIVLTFDGVIRHIMT